MARPHHQYPGRKDWRGWRTGRLVVLEYAYSKPDYRGHPQAYWRCICDCGGANGLPGERIVRRDHLFDGDAISCGCLRRENINLQGISAELPEGAWDRDTFSKRAFRERRRKERTKISAEFANKLLKRMGREGQAILKEVFEEGELRAESE